MNLTTPKEIDGSIQKLCEKLPAPGAPLFLDLFPERDAVLGDCYGNVEKKISRDGGSIQYGWCVWLAEGQLIEGEFHAVWISPDGELVDITPKPDGEKRILFIPDEKTVYQNVPIDNVRAALTNDPSIAEFIALAEQATNLRRLFSDEKGYFNPPSAISQPPIEGRSKIGRNDPCPCGSGAKYKKCCLL